ncbi:MAG: glycosyltransferase family 39 protein [Acidobacteria bacterium]|nr:glycosyltransferase family 39 protein [Acidobacteriota bacterium]
MTRSSARSRNFLPAVAVVLSAVAVWFRASRLFRAPLWLDEAYSAHAVEKGFAFTWTVVPTYDVHPPLYYTILGLWSLLAGDSLAGLRMFGVVCGLLTIVIVAFAAFELARSLDLDGPMLVACSALLAAFSPLMIAMSREVRPYAAMILAFTLALAGMLRAVRDCRDTGRVEQGAFLLYLVGLTLTFWLHNVGPLFGASLTIAFVVLVAGCVKEKRELGFLAGGHVLVALLYLPGFLMLLDQATAWTESTWLTFRLDGLHWKLAALWGANGIVAIVSAALLIALALYRSYERRNFRTAMALVICAVLPPALAVALSMTVSPVFLIRTLSPVAIPALLLQAAGGASLFGKWRLASLAFLLVVLSQMITVDVIARRAGPREDWYGAVRWLEQRMRPGDVIYAYPNEGALPLDRAVRDVGLTLPTRPIPTAVPSTGIGWHPNGGRGAVSLSRETLRAIAEAPATERVPTVWLLRLGPWSYDKGDVFVEELAKRRDVVDRWQSGAIDIIGLRKR